MNNSKRLPSKEVVDTSGVPNIGPILKRLRAQYGHSMREVAEATGISQSFLSQLEREVSDISLGNLAKIANFYGHDIGSFLGYSTRLTQPLFVPSRDRAVVSRGRGVRYESVRLAALDMEIQVITFQPRAAYKDAITHEGLDVFMALDGDLVLTYAGRDFVVKRGECALFSAAAAHKLRNDTDERVTGIALTTGKMF